MKITQEKLSKLRVAMREAIKNAKFYALKLSKAKDRFKFLQTIDLEDGREKTLSKLQSERDRHIAEHEAWLSSQDESIRFFSTRQSFDATMLDSVDRIEHLETRLESTETIANSMKSLYNKMEKLHHENLGRKN